MKRQLRKGDEMLLMSILAIYNFIIRFSLFLIDFVYIMTPLVSMRQLKQIEKYF